MIYGKHCWDNSLLEFLRMQSCLVITRSNNSRIRTAASRVKHGSDFVLTKVAKSRELCGVCCILQKSDRVITSSHCLPRDACHIWNKKQRFCHWSLFLLWIRQPQRNSKLRSPFPHRPIWYRKALLHYSDVRMNAMASQITGVSIDYSTVCSGADQENLKATRHWPLWGEYTGDREFPTQRASNAENVSIWWRRHGLWQGRYCDIL